MNIYVGNLAPDVTEDDLKQLFATHGQIQSVMILRDKFTGEPRGFAFVEMQSKEEAQAAINALNGVELKGRGLKVNEARPKVDHRSSGGYGGNRSYFSGGGGGGGGRRGDHRGGGGGGGKRRW